MFNVRLQLWAELSTALVVVQQDSAYHVYRYQLRLAYGPASGGVE
jgi:hypothetical protein